jgi:hypothetical protein
MDSRESIRISELLLRCCDGSAKPGEPEELESLLYNNREAQEYYVDLLMDLNYFHCLGQSAPPYDMNGDGLITIQDLAFFAEDWLAYPEPAEAQAIVIDPATTYQEIEGFGASLTDSSAWLIHEFLNASERQAVLTDLFDPDEGIGLSYLRQPMGASDFRLQDYSYDDLPPGVSSDYTLSYFSIAYDESTIIPTLQQILSINPNVRIMGSPWSPPVWMKTSGHIGGGSLKSNVYAVNANASDEVLKLEWNGRWAAVRQPARSIMTFRWDDAANAKVDVWLTTGDQASLLEPRRPVYFHD